MSAARILRRLRDLLDVDATNIADGKVPVYRTSSGKHEYEVVTGGGTNIVVQEGDSTVVATTSSLDFAAADFDVTESPSGEGNIALSSAVYKSGGTDVAVADGGTGASDAATARTNLGLVIGTDVQAPDAALAAIAGLTSAADRLPYFTGSGTAALATFTAAGRALVDDADASAQRTTLGLGSLATLSTITSSEITDGTIVNADVSTSAAIAISKLADPTTGKVIGSSGSAAAAVYPPGYEFGYDQITTASNVSSTTESSGDAIISCAAHTFDGSPVLLDVCFPVFQVGPVGNAQVIISLFESTTQIARLFDVQCTNGAVQVRASMRGAYRFTPSSGSHTYTITAHKVGAFTASIGGGATGTGAFVPAFARFIKV